jgi:hypothetical protein
MKKQNPSIEQYSGKIVPYDLNAAWNSHWLMAKLRENVRPLVEEAAAHAPVPFDPQDLEHQSLFYLTTLNPSELTDSAIVEAVDSQRHFIEKRLASLGNRADLDYLFRGLTGRHHDLNTADRLKLKKDSGRIKAVGIGRELTVEFRKIEDPKVVSLFTGDLHYIHQQRADGDAFGLFFAGDPWPWAVETAEMSSLARPYKRAALAAHGLNPDNAAELTRLYTLPGCPLNAVSILDGLVARHYREQGVEAMFTRTMPAYSKSKSTTVAGGMNRVLCLKELKHFFEKDTSGGADAWRPVTRRYVEEHPHAEIRMTDPAFRLLPAVDVFMTLRRAGGPADPRLNATSAIFFNEPGLPAKTYARNHHRNEKPAQEAEAFLAGFRHPVAALRGLLAGAR